VIFAALRHRALYNKDTTLVSTWTTKAGQSSHDIEMENAWAALCSDGQGMVPYTVQLLTLVWTEVPEVKSQVCENLSAYLQKSNVYGVSRASLAQNISMLEKCAKANLMHATVDNFITIIRAEIFLLRELCLEILQHIRNANTHRKTPQKVLKYLMQPIPSSYANYPSSMQDRQQQISDGWRHSANTNGQYPSGMATFSMSGAIYPSCFEPPRWHMAYA